MGFLKLLLDTHVLLWALLEPQKLSPALRNALEDSDTTLLVSAASAWEIATKWRLGKLQQARSVVENYTMDLHRLAAVDLPITADVARQAGLWDVPHRDPFDRLLAAQALADELVLASTDPAFAQFARVVTLR
ncbi:MAG: type II toxin-antitoxin system VapC family toxin [Cyanobacteriota bacterium]|nr:type II toxin-antitoxin system VapC family toxin [Cyanobacteriota bacterium]